MNKTRTLEILETMLADLVMDIELNQYDQDAMDKYQALSFAYEVVETGKYTPQTAE